MPRLSISGSQFEIQTWHILKKHTQLKKLGPSASEGGTAFRWGALQDSKCWCWAKLLSPLMARYDRLTATLQIDLWLPAVIRMYLAHQHSTHGVIEWELHMQLVQAKPRSKGAARRSCCCVLKASSTGVEESVTCELQPLTISAKKKFVFSFWNSFNFLARKAALTVAQTTASYSERKREIYQNTQGDWNEPFHTFLFICIDTQWPQFLGCADQWSVPYSFTAGTAFLRFLRMYCNCNIHIVYKC